jgi:tetratricopeptide (TPR) repeat protein
MIRSTLTFDDRESQHSVESSFQNYYSQNPGQIKEELTERANRFYNESTSYFNEGNFEKTISLLNKAFTLNSFNIQFYLLKIESFIQLCDFMSALITINKLLSILSVWSNNEASYTELKLNLLKKTAFCHFAQGQTYFDYKLYLEALESFNKASELLPTMINYKIRSIVCLYSLGRLHEAVLYLNKVYLSMYIFFSFYFIRIK